MVTWRSCDINVVTWQSCDITVVTRQSCDITVVTRQSCDITLVTRWHCFSLVEMVKANDTDTTVLNNTELPKDTFGEVHDRRDDSELYL